MIIYGGDHPETDVGLKGVYGGVACQNRASGSLQWGALSSVDPALPDYNSLPVKIRRRQSIQPGWLAGLPLSRRPTPSSRSWSAFELTRMARTTAQLIVVASIELVVRTVVLDFIELEAFIVNELVVTGLWAEDDMAFRAGNVEDVLDEEIAV